MGGERQLNKPLKIPEGVEIRQSKNRSSIRIGFWYKGIQCRETLKLEPTPSNLKYAGNLRGEILNKIELGTFYYTDYFPESERARLFGHFRAINTNVTIRELLVNFLEQIKLTNHKSTYVTYKKRCDAHLFDAFGDIPVKALAPITIRKWILSLNLKPKTVRNILIPLRTVLEEAVNDDIIERSPLDRVKLNKLLSKKTPDKKENKKEYKVDPFDINEINAILARAEYEQACNLFQFAFFTGLRPSELMALEWQDIDWVNGQVYVQRAVVEREEKCTKTEASKRFVLLLPPAMEALQKQKAFTFMEGKRVFHNPKTDRPWVDDHQLRRSCWQYMLRRAGVRYRNPYQTRHTYASMMLSAGENMLWVAKQMGHVDTEMIIKTYGKWIPDPTSKVGYKPVNDWARVLKTNTQPASSKHPTNQQQKEQGYKPVNNWASVLQSHQA